MFRALGDKNRYNIICLLLENHYCVGALANRLNISQAAVSQHLQVLRKVGLVWGEKRGYWTHYLVNKKALEAAGLELQRVASLPNPPSSDCSHDRELGKKCKCEGGEIE